MDILANAILLAALTAPLVVLALTTATSRLWIPALTFLALLALDDLLTSLPQAVDALDLLPGYWNWEGKILSLLLALAFAGFSALSARDAGLTVRQRPGSLRGALIALVLLTFTSFGLGLYFGGGAPDLETLAFQFTAPGLVEELVYRGLFIGLLHKALPDATGLRKWWPVVITAVAFGIWHGLGVKDGAIEFDLLSASFPFVGGLAYGWLREHTGSIVFPVVAHSFGNTIALLGAAISG